MKIKLKHLKLNFKKSVELIEFKDVNYFFGQMGAGKTSIVKLIDFCLGSDLKYSPALQQEFISATLLLELKTSQLSIQRLKDSAQKVIVKTRIKDEEVELVVPLDGGEEVIPETGIESLSDLIYYLSEITAPKVKRSKKNEDSPLQRLSLRNLLWYCYLDQDYIDSSFFNLDPSSDTYKRLQSRDVLRYVLGFHQEKVAELEIKLQDIKDDRRQLNLAANALQAALSEIDVGTIEEIHSEIESYKLKVKRTSEELSLATRELSNKVTTHGSDSLKKRIRYLSTEIDALKISINEVEHVIKNDNLHLNELKLLQIKIKRDKTSREVLQGVDFKTCPCCFKELPEVKDESCRLCGQNEDVAPNNKGTDLLEIDIVGRIKDVELSIKNHVSQKQSMLSRIFDFEKDRELLEIDLNKVMEEYDSAYLSTIIGKEKYLLEIQQKILSLEKIQLLPGKAEGLKNQSNILSVEIQEVSSELKGAREEAEKDSGNLKVLEELFLESLVRSKLPGIKSEDTVEISSPDYLPEVFDSNIGRMNVTSFSNLSSGGKKTLFKCCFALAFHVLAERNGANLPSFLIIDSPMKNISERENKDQFESFLALIYQLAENELSNTQIIIVDKEYFPPYEEFKKDILVRHMQPLSEEFPPLIPYYKGH